METPHEQQQAELLKRIITNISEFNHSLQKLNQKLESVRETDRNVDEIAQKWTHYHSASRLYIDNTKQDNHLNSK
ncbi:DASH complex subunit DAD4 [Choanephora cucurbitarum]|uniref:DASH complex subunit DAD4 n=1 Tax=Choanephora cucurbitarum TaxID=101091 RepID=A0A1C7NEY6_9FUNG|nr:DASH complex subunit DAD4 [Choanephora cucurbitarum]